MKRTLKKAERMMQIEQILLANPHGLTRVELARRLGVHRSTIWRDINDLSTLLPIWEDGDIIGIDRDAYLINTGLTIHESMAVHLAIRLLSSNSENQNPHAAAVVRKLSESLNSYSPQIARHLKASAEIAEKHIKEQSLQHLPVLETLTRAWADGVKTKVQINQGGKLRQCLLSPYFIEPYKLDRATHVTGWQEPDNKLLSLDISHITQAELTDEMYTIPPDFDITQYHPHAAGGQKHVSDGDATTVLIKFNAHVAKQVQSTQWHPSQQFTPLLDGGVLMQLEVEEPLSLLPWVQSWGADCEVLAPSSLRTAITKEVQTLARLYNADQPQEAIPESVLQLLPTGNRLKQREAMIMQ